MSSNFVNQSAYLRTSREFPEDIHQLSIEVNKSYLDTANAVNARTIGIYPTNRPAITGNSYFITSSRQQSIRQVYTFTGTSDLDIGFKLANISQIVQMYGNFETSGTPIYGLIPATNVAIAGQISFYLDINGASTTTDVIKFVLGAGSPTLTSGTIILEWLSHV